MIYHYLHNKYAYKYTIPVFRCYSMDIRCVIGQLKYMNSRSIHDLFCQKQIDSFLYLRIRLQDFLTTFADYHR